MEKDTLYTFVSVLRNKTDLAILERETASKRLLDFERCTKEDVFIRIEEDMENSTFTILKDDEIEGKYKVFQNARDEAFLYKTWASPQYTMVRVLDENKFYAALEKNDPTKDFIEVLSLDEMYEDLENEIFFPYVLVAWEEDLDYVPQYSIVSGGEMKVS